MMTLILSLLLACATDHEAEEAVSVPEFAPQTPSDDPALATNCQAVVKDSQRGNVPLKIYFEVDDELAGRTWAICFAQVRGVFAAEFEYCGPEDPHYLIQLGLSAHLADEMDQTVHLTYCTTDGWKVHDPLTDDETIFVIPYKGEGLEYGSEEHNRRKKMPAWLAITHIDPDAAE